jgi:hypothetical protein
MMTWRRHHVAGHGAFSQFDGMGVVIITLCSLYSRIQIIKIKGKEKRT